MYINEYINCPHCVSRNLADVDKDGQLDCEEFCIALHLCDCVKMGVPLPPKLPPDLMPAKSRSGSFNAPTSVHAGMWRCYL